MSIQWTNDDEYFTDDTPDADALEPEFRAHNAVITVVMYTPNGNKAGEVMRDSYAHRWLLAGGYTEAAQS